MTHDLPDVVERNGCRLRYRLAGPPDRPLVMFTHGAGVDHRSWLEHAARLADRYRVLLWDVRGHAHSRPAQTPFTLDEAVADTLALLDAAGSGPQVVLVGHSMGGNIAQEVAFRHPERVAALALVGCTWNTATLSRADRLRLAIGVPLLRLYPWETLKRQSAHVSAVTPAGRAYIYEAMSQLTKAELVAVMTELTRGLHPELDYRIPHPFLLVHGDRDRTGNIARIAPQWAAHEPNCRYVVVPNAGHMTQLDNPTFLTHTLTAFLHQHLP